MLEKIIYPSLSYDITGLCLKVHRDLGRFAKEKQYCDYLEQLLEEKGFHYKRENRISFINGQIEVKGNIVDFIIENKIILEAKAIPYITKEDYYQIMRYLTLSKIKLGLLVNFRSKYLKPKRIINYNLQEDELSHLSHD